MISPILKLQMNAANDHAAATQGFSSYSIFSKPVTFRLLHVSHYVTLFLSDQEVQMLKTLKKKIQVKSKSEHFINTFYQKDDVKLFKSQGKYFDSQIMMLLFFSFFVHLEIYLMMAFSKFDFFYYVNCHDTKKRGVVSYYLLHSFEFKVVFLFNWLPCKARELCYLA